MGSASSDFLSMLVVCKALSALLVGPFPSLCFCPVSSFVFYRGRYLAENRLPPMPALRRRGRRQSPRAILLSILFALLYCLTPAARPLIPCCTAARQLCLAFLNTDSVLSLLHYFCWRWILWRHWYIAGQDTFGRTKAGSNNLPSTVGRLWICVNKARGRWGHFCSQFNHNVKLMWSQLFSESLVYLCILALMSLVSCYLVWPSKHLYWDNFSFMHLQCIIVSVIFSGCIYKSHPNYKYHLYVRGIAQVLC